VSPTAHFDRAAFEARTDPKTYANKLAVLVLAPAMMLIGTNKIRLALVAAAATIVGCASARPIAYPTSDPEVLRAPAAQGPIETSPTCPADAWWDGFVCRHAPATCGGWNGLFCESSSPSSLAVERPIEQEFDRIDADARTVCPESDETRQVYSGNVHDILTAAETALQRTEDIEERLDRVIDGRRTPRWTIQSLASEGRLYECIWNSMRLANPTFFTTQQLATLAKLQTISGGRPANTQTRIPGRTPPVPQWPFLARRTYLAKIAQKMVGSYVAAELLARRHALGGIGVTRCRERLGIIASILGDDAMSALVAEVPDPTDPHQDPNLRRHARYVAGMFAGTP
jgi:hypothetical protein